MIAYLDASALVKRYVAEAGSDEVAAPVDAASVVGTSIVSRAEVAYLRRNYSPRRSV